MNSSKRTGLKGLPSWCICNFFIHSLEKKNGKTKKTLFPTLETSGYSHKSRPCPLSAKLQHGDPFNFCFDLLIRAFASFVMQFTMRRKDSTKTKKKRKNSQSTSFNHTFVHSLLMIPGQAAP